MIFEDIFLGIGWCFAFLWRGSPKNWRKDVFWLTLFVSGGLALYLLSEFFEEDCEGKLVIYLCTFLACIATCLSLLWNIYQEYRLDKRISELTIAIQDLRKAITMHGKRPKAMK